MSGWCAGEFTLDELIEKWLGDLEGQVCGRTQDLYRLHWETHLLPWFGALSGLNRRRVGEYCRDRLKSVKRTTLQKERSTLRGFLAWCREMGYLEEQADLIPELPKRATGTPFEQRRRGSATPLSPEECRRLIAALPLWSTPRGKREPFLVRGRFVVAYETSLRPATLDQLSVPEHYSRGAELLRVTDPIDKNRFGRELPLTKLARLALDSVLPDEGLIFGKHDYRDQLEKAAKKAKLPPEKARTFCAYDFRHARATELAETGNLTGAAYMLGHKRVTTTSIYVRPGLRAAERVLAAVEKDPVTQIRLAGLRKALRNRECEGEDSNLHGSYPASTSIVGGDHKAGDGPFLTAAAESLLIAAAGDHAVEPELLESFALQALESTEIGRLALGVIDGGVHAPRRALELAQLISATAAAGADRLEGEG